MSEPAASPTFPCRGRDCALTRHAARRMERRGLTVDDVRAAVEHGRPVVQGNGYVRFEVPKGSLCPDDLRRLAGLTIVLTPTCIRVVTVYWPIAGSRGMRRGTAAWEKQVRKHARKEGRS
jgi:hypothetical protein